MTIIHQQENPEIPCYLYKYRIINCYTRDMLVNHELYYPSPATFNDPFDSWANIILGSNIKEFNQKSRELCQKYGEVKVSNLTEGLIALIIDPA